VTAFRGRPKVALPVPPAVCTCLSYGITEIGIRSVDLGGQASGSAQAVCRFP
jgi:hypothetical protein